MSGVTSNDYWARELIVPEELLLTDKEIDELMETATQISKKMDNQQRFGQLIFNEISFSYPELGEHIRTTTLDPFFDDGRVIDLMIKISKTKHERDSKT